MLWLLDFDWRLPGACPREAQAIWRSVEGQQGRAYAEASISPGPGWEALEALESASGPSSGERPAFHYSVETDVAPEHEADFNAWYAQEHLPGLAAVPGTVRAARYRRVAGQPRYLACYDLGAIETLERPEWLAVRHTAWSSRIRPLFVNPRRTLFVRP
jgi:hypothetical protein